MKKLITICLLNITVGIMQAQENVSVGPIAGFGDSWMSGEGKNNGKHTWNAGLMLNYSPNTHWGFGTELKLSEEGTNKTIGTYIKETQINYIRIPLKLIYFFGEYGDRLRPKMSIGLTNGFLVGGEMKLKTNLIDGNPVILTEKAKDFAYAYDLGVQAAVGLNYRLVEKIWLNVQAGYYHGLLDTKKGSDDMKNRNLALTLGITFGIGQIKQ